MKDFGADGKSSGPFALLRDGWGIPRLGPGSRVGVVAPSGPPCVERVGAGCDLLTARGYEVINLYEYEGAGDGSGGGDPTSGLPVPPYLAGRDRERARALEDALTRPDLDVVWAARGGYGATRILPLIDWEKVARARARFVIGFSDITAILARLTLLGSRFNGLVLHGPNVGGLRDLNPADTGALFSFLEGKVAGGNYLLPEVGSMELLSGPDTVYPVMGVAWAGNLTVLSRLVGTSSAPDLKGSVLFLEDVGEAPYRIDRALTHVRQAGLLNGVKALVLGRFFPCDRAQKEAEEAVLSALEGLPGLPVMAGYPFGHGDRNRCIPAGSATVLLDPGAGTVSWPSTGSLGWEVHHGCSSAVPPEVLQGGGGGGDGEGKGEGDEKLPAFPEITNLLHQMVDLGVVPGAVFAGGNARELLHLSCSGWARVKPGFEPVTPHTMFDLASLTKPMVTVAAAMLAVDEGRLDLNMPVSRVFEGWGRGLGRQVQVRHLLSHSSGLPGWMSLWDSVLPDGRKPRTGPIKQAILERVIGLEPEVPAGTRTTYSDMGFILLFELLARLLGESPVEYVNRRVYQPLGLSSLHYVSLLGDDSGVGVAGVGGDLGGGGSLARLNYAATEECPWRGRLVVGEVHDENAHALGGVCGHAGLFGTALHVLRFGQEILGALLGRSTIFSKNVVEEFFGPDLPISCSAPSDSYGGQVPGGGVGTWALGWDRPSVDGTSSGGTKASPRARGHLGFTGTSIWIDPAREAVGVLLTNRVHYGRMDTRLKQYRPLIHDLFWDRC